MPTRPYYVDVPLRWSDMDALRHVNNVQFLRLLEEARVHGLREWFESTAADRHRPPMLIARAEIDYVRQLHYREEPIVIAMWVPAISGASFDLAYEVLSSREPDAELYAVAETTQVAFDMETQRPKRLSDADREVLERYAGESPHLKRRPKDHL
ncbi:acyl-CoA thioesterase [Flexivirga sp. ID2601S]|uniref:Acyl-CoA thioesterase n=1 Tax=Flexivirga aerilata TaxID=1656889 RepID=A0A849AGA7_9MICO|nr:acyl-CoA thioesterase [Flexivirga aerilata]NNG39439.1 acyl-CoA thioesterase [Flexivirga aerilata]